MHLILDFLLQYRLETGNLMSEFIYTSWAAATFYSTRRDLNLKFKNKNFTLATPGPIPTNFLFSPDLVFIFRDKTQESTVNIFRKACNEAYHGHTGNGISVLMYQSR